jgi:hypothetical protein
MFVLYVKFQGGPKFQGLGFPIGIDLTLLWEQVLGATRIGKIMRSYRSDVRGTLGTTQFAPIIRIMLFARMVIRLEC